MILCCFIYFSYKINNLETGDLLDVSLRAEACFNDGGPCAVNVTILSNALIPKWNKEWSLQYPVKGLYQYL